MRERPRIQVQDRDVVASAIEFRQGPIRRPDGGDWYVTWMTCSRPWEISVMRLAERRSVGRAWHHGRGIEYRVDWTRRDLRRSRQDIAGPERQSLSA